MNPRLATLAELCRETVLPASVLACLTLGAADAEYTKAASKAAPIVSRIAPALAADARAARQPQPVTSNYTALGKAIPAKADVATANAELAPSSASAVTSDAAVAEAGLQPTTEAAPQAAPAEHEQTPPPHQAEQPIVTASLGDSSDVRRRKRRPHKSRQRQCRRAQRRRIRVTPSRTAIRPPIRLRILDECYVVDTCVDRYLWALYQRTPKEDSVKIRRTKAGDGQAQGQAGDGYADDFFSCRRGFRVEGPEGC